MIVDCAVYRNGHRTEDPVDFSDALDTARAAGDSFVWIGLHEPTRDEFDLVMAEFGLHPLAVEDAVTAHQRPKLETYQDSQFMVLKTIGYHEDGHAVSTGEVMIFLGDCFVMTVRHGDESPLAELRSQLEKQPEVLRHGPSAVLYSVCDMVVDTYLDVASALQADMDELEAHVFAPGRPAADTAERIHGVKRQLVAFRRATAPLQEPMERLAGGTVPFVLPESLPYLRSVADQLHRANEQLAGLDRLLSDILNANLTQVGVQQNDDGRKISAWAAVALVPTMIAGVYGMRFDHIPELGPAWAYPVALAGMAMVCVALYRVFKRSGWL